MWAIVKRSVETQQPKNISELERFMVEVWDNITQNVIINLIKSMNGHCQLVIDNNGERIPY